MSTDTFSQIKQIINNNIPNVDILLFGSRARGESVPDSDYDLMIIFHNPIGNKEKLHFRALIRKQLALSGIDADVIIESDIDIETKKVTVQGLLTC
ncbi:MAG: nucleotidyltransferase domain-containing protein [Bacteroidota bacterium]